jgi:Mn-dependent DtxR family transcriptional regulator
MIELIKTLSATEFKIWFYIYTLRNENNIVFKTGEDIKKELTISHRTVYLALSKLKDLDLLDVQGQRRIIKVLKEPQ